MAPLTRGPHVIHHVDAERSPHHKQIAAQLHYDYFHFDTSATRVPVKNGNKHLYTAKITCESQLCATATKTEGENEEIATESPGLRLGDKGRKIHLVKVNKIKIIATKFFN